MSKSIYRNLTAILLTLAMVVSLFPTLTLPTSAAVDSISVELGAVTRKSGYYTCDLALSSDARMVTISVDSGYFTVPSLDDSVLTFLGGTQGTSYISTFTESTPFESAVFSFTDVTNAKNLLSDIQYYHDGTNNQTIKATASLVSPNGNDMYFEGHFYSFIKDSADISWPKAVVNAGETEDPYFGGRGYLATVTSQAENSILLRLTKKEGDSWYSAWLGALWQRNEGTVKEPNIVRGTDGNEISYDNVCAAMISGNKSNNWSGLLPAYVNCDYGFTSGNYSTYIYNNPESIKYYWIDGPEAGDEIANNTENFAPWHVDSSEVQNEPNNGNFVYLGWDGAYWDDLGLENNLQKPASGYVVEFSGYGDGGSCAGKIASDTKTVAETWSYPSTDPVEFTQGNGTESTPYLISCAQDLANLAYFVNNGRDYTGTHFKLTADIELNLNVLNADGSLNSGSFASWTAIGTSDTPLSPPTFNGIFDGNNHTISGVFIDDATAEYQGLFGYVLGGTVKNVGVVNSYIKGKSQVGGVCGVNTDGTIENCFNSGTVISLANGKHNYVGGVCGQNDSNNGTAKITHCYNTGKVELTQGTGIYKAVGGVCGKNYSGDKGITASITNCYNTGTVTGTENAGGVCGWNGVSNGTVTVTNCYNTGAVTGTENVGGVCGWNKVTGGTAKITHCYNTGKVELTQGTGSYKAVGGVCGHNQSGKIEHTYYTGCNVGIGEDGASQNGATPFVQIQDNPLAIGATTSIVEQTDMKWNDALGSDFAVSYANYHATIANINEKTVTGATVGQDTLTGTMRITQNELTNNGFDGETKTISVDFSTPLTVQKATPTLSLTASPDSPVACSSEITLTATLDAGYHPSGTVTFKNGETVIGSPAAITEGKASINYTSSEAIVLNMLAEYSGDSSNYPCNSNLLPYSILPPSLPPETSFSLNGENAGKLMGTTTQMKYSIDGGNTWNSCTAPSTELSSVLSSITAEHDILIKDMGNGTSSTESTVQTIDITKADTPELTPTQPSRIGGNGSIPLSTIHEYRANDGITWTPASGTASLASGTYFVRVMATGTVLASDAQSITLTAFTGKAESTPEADVDYVAETLTNLIANAHYAVNGTDVTADSNGTLSIENSWFGSTVSLVKKGDGIITNDSTAQSIPLTARPVAPICTVTQPSAHSTAGIVSGISLEMQYSSDNGSTWSDGNGSDVTDLSPGTVLIRKKATSSAPVGLIQTITIIEYIPPHHSSNSRRKPAYNASVKAENSNTVRTLPVTIDKDTAKASVDINSQKLGSSGTIVAIPSVPDARTYSIGIPVPDLSTEDTQKILTVETDEGSITVPSNMLTGVENVNGNKAQLSIGVGNQDNLPADVKERIAERPLIQLSLSIDGRRTNWNNPSAEVTVSIPYTPTTEELMNPDSIVVWYIDGSGNLITIPNGRYDSASQTVTFKTTHFSLYAVGYNPVSFCDVADTAWYYNSVSFIAARGITSGMGEGMYSPETKLTRGQFIVMLMRAYGIAPNASLSDNFADAGNTYYSPYLASAKRLGIASGIGNNMYAPDKEITHQEMFTLLYQLLKIVDRLPQGDSGKTVSDFSDASHIDEWARLGMETFVTAGIISGSEGNLTPTGTTTRAEMAQVLYNLLQK